MRYELVQMVLLVQIVHYLFWGQEVMEKSYRISHHSVIKRFVFWTIIRIELVSLFYVIGKKLRL